MKISKVIENLGYKYKEVKVYLATRALGESKVSDISNRVDMPRSSTQVSLEKLHKSGLVNFYVRKNRKYWITEPLEKLLNSIREKEKSLVSAIKDLKLSKNNNMAKPRVKVFNDVEDLRILQDSIIEAKRNISAILPWDMWLDTMGQEYIDDFIAARVRNFLNINVLVSKTASSLKLKDGDSKDLRKIKFLPSDINIENAVFIFGDSIAIITLNKSQPTGIIIEDPSTARTMNVFFQNLWERGSD
ncbi:MAG: ArsR family transcriptional regulator [Patescibacteria group bacterium]|nr:ArsR family transcriptional regulator [Patescibacteria group bacterium]